MGVYVGDVWIPFISDFTVDDGERTVQIIKHIDSTTPPHIAEFPNPITSAKLSGTIIKNSSSIKTADNYAEDLLSLMGRKAAYNYINTFQGRAGWLSVKSASAPKDASRPLSREYTVDGTFLSMNTYQAAIKTAPKITSNPWGFTLGNDDCDNLISVPIGAAYTGGDGTTYSEDTEDGTMVSVVGNTNSIIRYDMSVDEVDVGEVKIYDDMDGATEDAWIRVYNINHDFAGKMVVQNGTHRAIFYPATDKFALYGWYDEAYVSMDSFTAGAFGVTRILELNPNKAIVSINSYTKLTLERGRPFQIDTTTTLAATTIYVPDSTTTIENYVYTANDVYIASNANFTTVNATKSLGTGRKWIFWEGLAADAEKTAHRLLVERRLISELLER
jgi:hypothetical protein